MVKGKASFFWILIAGSWMISELVTARVLDANLNPVSIGQAVAGPRRFTSVSPRFDYAINPRNTLVARYSYFIQL